MKFYKQLFRHDPQNGIFGDCYRTIIGCFLDIEPKDVPHFFDWHGVDAEKAKATRLMIEKFLMQHKLQIFQIPYAIDDLDVLLKQQRMLNPNIFYMLSGTSKSGCDHVVIAHNDHIVHDPSLNNSGIIGPCTDDLFWIELLIPIHTI